MARRGNHQPMSMAIGPPVSLANSARHHIGRRLLLFCLIHVDWNDSDDWTVILDWQLQMTICSYGFTSCLEKMRNVPRQ